MTARKLLVVDFVGLTPALLERAPRLRAIASRGLARPLESVFPAVTCSAQASFLAGAPPSQHGIVGNGWYFRRLDEVLFWRQSRYLIEGETIFDDLKKAGKTSANIFGWYNWNCGADWSVTPKPSYPADGRKIPGVHTEPEDLRFALERELGPFPLFDFWGPRAGIVSSEWIARAARNVIESKSPDFVFCYLPHLDYDHQRYGPDDPRSQRALGELDRIAGELCESALARGYDILGFSEYGISAVGGCVMINKALRGRGWLRVRRDPAVGELPLFGTSGAFAVCDHQVAHVYIRNPADIEPVSELLQSTQGVKLVLDKSAQREFEIDHINSGELIAVASEDRWFAYNYWLDDAQAPDFARTVDIHRKPGYDPAELFIDPALAMPATRVAWTLLKKKLGFRYLMKVVSLDPTIVRGSHGRRAAGRDGAVLLTTERLFADNNSLRGSPWTAATRIVDLRAAIRDYFMK